MRRRRKYREEPENHDRWLISYADFITLLFAFFVVMYAVSSVNEGKYRVLSDSIVSAFRSNPNNPAAGQGEVSVSQTPMILPSILPPRPSSSVRPPINTTPVQQQEALRDVTHDLRQALAPLVEQGKVHIMEGTRGIIVDIDANLLFGQGEAQLGAAAVTVLGSMADILVPTNFPIIVEGHTDNVPIATAQYPSNWELSGARASSVVRLLVAHGVAGARLTATGYADQRPIADNSTPAGQAMNRRVTITIESEPR